jgi:hypothetical protein
MGERLDRGVDRGRVIGRAVPFGAAIQDVDGSVQSRLEHDYREQHRSCAERSDFGHSESPFQGIGQRKSASRAKEAGSACVTPSQFFQNTRLLEKLLRVKAFPTAGPMGVMAIFQQLSSAENQRCDNSSSKKKMESKRNERANLFGLRAFLRPAIA